MCASIFILNVCLLIALVATNPIPQEINTQAYPGMYCDETAYKNSLIDFLNAEYASDATPRKPEAICQTNEESDTLLRLLYDRVLSNPVILDTIGDIQRSNNAYLTNQNQRNVPNIVNNYIILPPDIIEHRHNGQNSDCTSDSPTICTRVKKNVDKPVDITKNELNPQISKELIEKDEKINKLNDKISNEMLLSNTTKNNQKGKKRKYLRNNLQVNNDPTQRAINNKSTDSNELLINENRNSEINEIGNVVNKEIMGKELKSNGNISNKSNEISVKKQNKNRSLKTTIPRKKKISLKYDEKLKDQTESKTSELIQSKDSKKTFNRNRGRVSNVVNHSRSRQKNTNLKKSENVHNNAPINQGYQFPNMPYNSNDMYKYIDAILSNYQLSNTNFKNDSPFNFNNIYQFPQPSGRRNSISTRRNTGKTYKRRNQPKYYRRKLGRKKTSKKKPMDKKLILESPNKINTNNIDVISPSLSLKTTIIPRTDIIGEINENISKMNNTLSSKETENNLTTIFNHNNYSHSEEASLYNSYPTFIVGMEDKVPIILENSLIDDYYPDFTADNEALQMTTEETNPKKYHGDKYHYVSNQNFDFGDYVKTRKRLAMKHINKNSNLFFSETDGNRDSKVSKQENKGNKDLENTLQFQSPLFLDNPDFRTRKVDSNDKYEPYYYHNIFQDPDEDFNKYYMDSPLVCDNVKNKACNDIDDDLTTKWKKIKDSNVETVHARSKLAKYGITM